MQPTSNCVIIVTTSTPIVQVLALTFDDGPNSKDLSGLVGVLDALKAEQAPATFFFNTRTNDFESPGVQVSQRAPGDNTSPCMLLSACAKQWTTQDRVVYTAEQGRCRQSCAV